MSDIHDSMIGQLTDVQDNILTARVPLTDRGKFPTVPLEGKNVPIGRLGSFVLIKEPGIKVVAMVVRASRDDGSQKHGTLTLIPLGELNKNNVFNRGVISYPTLGAEVHIIRSEEVNILFAKYRPMEFELGVLPSMRAVKVYLNPSVLYGRHLAILGQSGSGKSWAVASMLQKTVDLMQNAHVILLDLHGEYVWFDSDENMHSAFRDGTYKYMDARELEIPYWLLTYSELVDLLIDREDKQASTQMAFMREALLVMRKKANSHLQDINLSIDSPVYFSLVELFQQFKRANEQVTDFGKVKGPLYGHFDEFLIKLQSRFNDARYDFLFKPKRRRSSDTLADLLQEFVGLIEPKRQINVIDFSSIPFDVRPTVSAQIGRLAFEFNYWNPHSRHFPILLVCEEAHAYIPRESATQYEGTRKSMERIAKEGRKYGVGLTVVSQRPHELSETVLAQCGNFICLRVTNPDDQKYIRELVPDAEVGLINILSALGRGEAMILGEAVPIPTRFQLDRPYPEPNSNDIDYYSEWRSEAQNIDVNAIVDRWRRQGR